MFADRPRAFNRIRSKSPYSKDFPKDAQLEKVVVDTPYGPETVLVNDKLGPVVDQQDWSRTFVTGLGGEVKGDLARNGSITWKKPWTKMSTSEQNIVLQIVAKKNVKLREWMKSVGGMIENRNPQLTALSARAGVTIPYYVPPDNED